MNQSAVPDVSPATLEVVPLGGLGEFGMNMMAVSWEDTTVLIDAGVMFPEPDQLGVEMGDGVGVERVQRLDVAATHNQARADEEERK